MVLSLKTWKSRSLPGLPRTDFPLHDFTICLRRNKARSAIRMRKAAMGKTMAAFLFSRARGFSGAIRSRSRSRLFTGNESDKAGKHDLIRCDRVNVDIG